jgi:hypothetical protein
MYGVKKLLKVQQHTFHKATNYDLAAHCGPRRRNLQLYKWTTRFRFTLSLFIVFWWGSEWHREKEGVLENWRGLGLGLTLAGPWLTADWKSGGGWSCKGCPVPSAYAQGCPAVIQCVLQVWRRWITTASTKLSISFTRRSSSLSSLLSQLCL